MDLASIATWLPAAARPAPVAAMLAPGRTLAMTTDTRADEAMRRYAEGDDAAFAAVYDAIADRVYGYLRRLARDEARAEELLQQTFLRMHLARGRFTPGAAVVPWAFAIARRLFLDDVRAARNAESQWPEDGDALTVDLADPEVELGAARLSTRLADRFDRLPPNQREAFLLVRRDGLSFADAAAMLGTTIATVKLRAHRAVVALRGVLDDSPDAP